MNRLRFALLATLVMFALAMSAMTVPTALAAEATATPTPQPAQDRIFYVSDSYETFGDFYVMNGDGTGVRQISHHLFDDVGNALIKDNNVPYNRYRMAKVFLFGGLDTSPDGRYLALSWNIGIRDSRVPGDNLLATKSVLYIIDGTDYKIQTIPVDKIKRFSFIGWSADSKRLAFVAERDGKGQIDVVDVADNFSVKPFIQDDLDKDGPVWSPDGKWVVYVGNKDNKSQLYRADADGKNPISLTGTLKIDPIAKVRPNPSPYVKHLPEEKWQPDWSPDSKQVLVVSWQGVQGAIYIVDTDGGNAHQLVASGKGGGAGWLTNKTIVFGSDREAYDYYQQYRINSDGSGETRLSLTDARLNFFSFSSDRQRILYASDAGRAYVINADGTNQHVIKFGVYAASYWEPRQP